jgi:Mce-associated membrane protein
VNVRSPLLRHWPLLLAVVLLAGAGVAFWQADRVRDTDHVGNHAVVDDAASTDVQSAVSAALVRVFSFDYSDPEPTQQAADELLAGDARSEYDQLFATLEEKAPGQRLVLTAQVQVAAVQELTGDRATLLVFLDQASQRASDEESSISAAQLSVDAERTDGSWRIVALRPL